MHFSRLATALLLATSTPLANDPFVVTTPGSPGAGATIPQLDGTGPGTPGSTNALNVSGAPASSSTFLVAGLTELGLPVKGGVLGPTPDVVFPGFATDASGALAVPAVLRPDLPIGLEVWVQAWTDAGGAGLASSNTLKLIVQANVAPPPPLFPMATIATATADSFTPFGTSPSLHGIADVDADGALDLIAVDGTVALGLGDGRFGTPQPKGLAGSEVIVGDLDGDGRQDIVALRRLAGEVAVSLGVGDGSFGAESVVLAVDKPSAGTLADVDGDGSVDLVFVRDLDLVVAAGAGDGTFDAPTSVTTAPNVARAVAGDVDDDGDVDLCVGGWDETIECLLNAGDGTFTSSTVVQVGISTVGGPNDLEFTDVDDDGALDLVAVWTRIDSSFEGSGSLYVLLGDGAGGFTLQVPAFDLDEGGNSVEALHLDDDGAIDLAVLGEPGVLLLLLGDGTGTFGVARRIATANAPTWLSVGDLDCDGQEDLVSTHLDVDTTTTAASLVEPDADLLPVSDELQTLPLASPFGPTPFPRSISIGDVTDDGLPDLVTASAWQVNVFAGDGAGGFAPAAVFGQASGGFVAMTAVAVDFDGDGVVDVVGAGPGESVFVLRGTGGGAAAPVVTAAVGSSDVREVVVADVTGDGRLDLVARDDDDVIVMPGLAGGTLAAPVLLANTETTSLAAGDVDADGDVDVIATTSTGLALWLNEGSGSFAPRVDVSLPGQGDVAHLDDLDDDGDLDAVVIHRPTNDAAISTLLWNGTTFTPATLFETSGRWLDLTTDDFDGDGHVDVAATQWPPYQVAVLRGDGAGGLEPAGTFAAGDNGLLLGFVTTGDLDLDGAPDLAVGAQTVIGILNQR